MRKTPSCCVFLIALCQSLLSCDVGGEEVVIELSEARLFIPAEYVVDASSALESIGLPLTGYDDQSQQVLLQIPWNELFGRVGVGTLGRRGSENLLMIISQESLKHSRLIEVAQSYVSVQSVSQESATKLFEILKISGSWFLVDGYYRSGGDGAFIVDRFIASCLEANREVSCTFKKDYGGGAIEYTLFDDDIPNYRELEKSIEGVLETWAK